MLVVRDLTQALYVAAVALGRTRDADEAVRVAIAETQRAAGVEGVALYRLDSSRSTLVLQESAGTRLSFRARVPTVPLSDARLAAKALEERRVVTISVDQHPTPHLRSLFAEEGFRHLTVVPVAGYQQSLGILYLASGQEAPPTMEEAALIQAIGGLVGVALENAALRERMLAQQDRLRALAGGILRAREEEARRIAHELHDEAGQLLASLHIALDDLAKKIPAERADSVRGLHDLLDGVEAQLRRLSRELRPTILDDLGLAAALEWLAQGMAERTGLAITVDAPVRRVSTAAETAVYRVVQEALTNAVRHAQAKTVRVEVREEGSVIRVAVRDDGRGFDVGATLAGRGNGGLGLIGMRERVEALGGELSIVSGPGKGAELSITIPGGQAA
ncbi:MAG: GAF domain-containing sensor histidine kinase [Candidatus Methylomirabilia bacterium]